MYICAKKQTIKDSAPRIDIRLSTYSFIQNIKYSLQLIHISVISCSYFFSMWDPTVLYHLYRELSIFILELMSIPRLVICYYCHLHIVNIIESVSSSICTRSE